MQDPETYLTGIGVTVNCAMEKDRPAVLDAAHRTSIGFETFFFSSDVAKRAFDADMFSHCGIITDPVTKERFRPTKESPRSDYTQRLFLFAADSTRATFDMMPDMYCYPNYSMLPKQGEEPAAKH